MPDTDQYSGPNGANGHDTDVPQISAAARGLAILKEREAEMARAHRVREEMINLEVAIAADLSPAGYEVVRETIAERVGVRCSVLDRLVAEARRAKGGDADTGGQGRRLEIPDVEPWPHKVDGAEDQETTGTILLADIRAAFSERGADRLSSDGIVSYLIGLEGRPWAEYGKSQKPLTKSLLARLLRPFQVFPGTVQLGEGRAAPTAKGYHLSDFEDAFARYLPAFPDQTVKPSDIKQPAAFVASQTVRPGACLTVRNGEKPRGRVAKLVEIADGGHLRRSCYRLMRPTQEFARQGRHAGSSSRRLCAA